MTRAAALLSLVASLASWANCAAAPAGGTAIDFVRSGTAHESLFAIALAGQQAVAVGSGGDIITSADGGVSWKADTPAPTSLALLGVATNGTRAVAVGQKGLVLVHGAGDDGWTAVRSGTTNRLFSVSLNRKGEAIAVGAFGTVLSSTDGGTSWNTVQLAWKSYLEDGTEPHLYVAHVAEDGVITIAGEFGLILRSSPNGSGWTLAHKGDESLFALHLRDEGPGFAVGQSGTILRTGDRGATWNALQRVSTANLLGVHSTGSGHVIVTGMRDMLESMDEGQSWRHIVSAETTTSWYSGVGQADPAAPILIVGHSGQIGRLRQ